MARSRGGVSQSPAPPQTTKHICNVGRFHYARSPQDSAKMMMQSDANKTQTGDSDRWYYNAILTNTSKGAVSKTPARFFEQRTVPLCDDTSEYYVALARMSIQGCTSNFPILQPPLRRLTLPSERGTFISKYAMGVRYTLYCDTFQLPGMSGVREQVQGLVPVAYSELETVDLIFPSLHPSADLSDPSSSYYSVDFTSQIMDALNSAMTRLQYKFVNGMTPYAPGVAAVNTIPGVTSFTLPNLSTPFLPFPGSDAAGSGSDEAFNSTSAFNRKLQWLYFSHDNGLLTVRAPYGDVNPQAESANPVVYPQTVAASPTYPDVIANFLPPPYAGLEQFRVQAHVYFNEELLNLFPWRTESPVQSTASTNVAMLPDTANMDPFNQCLGIAHAPSAVGNIAGGALSLPLWRNGATLQSNVYNYALAPQTSTVDWLAPSLGYESSPKRGLPPVPPAPPAPSVPTQISEWIYTLGVTGLNQGTGAMNFTNQGTSTAAAGAGAKLSYTVPATGYAITFTVMPAPSGSVYAGFSIPTPITGTGNFAYVVVTPSGASYEVKAFAGSTTVPSATFTANVGDVIAVYITSTSFQFFENGVLQGSPVTSPAPTGSYYPQVLMDPGTSIQSFEVFAGSPPAPPPPTGGGIPWTPVVTNAKADRIGGSASNWQIVPQSVNQVKINNTTALSTFVLNMVLPDDASGMSPSFVQFISAVNGSVSNFVLGITPGTGPNAYVLVQPTGIKYALPSNGPVISVKYVSPNMSVFINGTQLGSSIPVSVPGAFTFLWSISSFGLQWANSTVKVSLETPSNVSGLVDATTSYLVPIGLNVPRSDDARFSCLLLNGSHAVTVPEDYVWAASSGSITISCLKWQQEFSSSSSWAVYTGMAITSNTIPAYEEAYGVNSIEDENTITTAGASMSNIIFDLDLSQDEIHQIQQGVSFVPSMYRYAKLRRGAIQNIDLNLFLRTSDGKFVPWVIDSGGTVSIKFMFTKTPY